MAEKVKSFLLNPNQYHSDRPDTKTTEMFGEIIGFMEHKGLRAMREDSLKQVFQSDWLKFQKEHQIFAKCMTLGAYGSGPEYRYDLARLCDLSELLAFYSGEYQYPVQVSVLGTGPIWMSGNEKQKKEMAQQLLEGHVSAFGMSEKDHGADLYANACTITPRGDGTYAANGNKYYIGNAHIASKVSVLGKNDATGEWAFWVVDSRHRNYNYVKDIQCVGLGKMRLGEFEMAEYPITDDDILTLGDKAFSDGLCTVNIGKFVVSFQGLGITAHAFYEAITHANRRMLYGQRVTDQPHIRAFLCEAFSRINTMKLFALRGRDYFRNMSGEDRRYLLFNPVQKMKVNVQGSEVVRLLMDVVCAKGYETENFLSEAYNMMDYNMRLEGTVHTNMSLILKFVPNYFFSDESYPEIGTDEEMRDDVCIFDQYQGGLAKITFPHYGKAYEGVEIPNVKRFKAQVDALCALMKEASPTQEQWKDKDFMLYYGEMFAMVVYGQLVLEGALLRDCDDLLLDQMFATIIRDTAKYALLQLSSQENSELQEQYLREIALTKPEINREKDMKYWKEYVQILDGAYIMNDAVIGNDGWHEPFPT